MLVRNGRSMLLGQRRSAIVSMDFLVFIHHDPIFKQRVSVRGSQSCYGGFRKV